MKYGNVDLLKNTDAILCVLPIFNLCCLSVCPSVTYNYLKILLSTIILVLFCTVGIVLLQVLESSSSDSLLCCSGLGGAQQSGGGVQGPGAAAGRACNGRGGGHPRPDSSVREAGGGAVHPGQRPTVCGHVPQLAAQCLRQVGQL